VKKEPNVGMAESAFGHLAIPHFGNFAMKKLTDYSLCAG
jgi:hypothetical protein